LYSVTITNPTRHTTFHQNGSLGNTSLPAKSKESSQIRSHNTLNRKKQTSFPTKLNQTKHYQTLTMYFATAAIASLVAAIAASTPVQADISLPILGNYEKADSHHFQATVALSLDKDAELTGEQLAIIEQAIILSSNESHDSNDYHMSQAAITKAKHGKKDNSNMEQTSLRASISSTSSGFWIWVGFDTRIYCEMCRDDDDGMLSEHESIKKNGKKNSALKKWEDTLCGILSQYEAFEGAVDCAIDVDYDHELPDVSAFTDYVE
jgi:hypothetical protein